MSLSLLIRRTAALAALTALLLPLAVSAQNEPPPGLSAVTEPSSIESELRQRAEAQFALGDIPAALSTYGVLETALTGTARSNARESLWQALNALPANTDLSNVTEPVARGWVELMQLARSGAPLAAYEDWRHRHPDHPGESQIAAGLVTRSSSAPHSGRQIALLLPMSGVLGAAAKSILAGAEAARSHADADAPTLLLLDSGAGLDSALATALTQGAASVIGPLRKEDVAAVAAKQTQLPTITLNYLDSSRTPPSGLTPFGLAPEDEARAAADHAAGRGLMRAVILAQDGDWGSRVAAAFKSQFELRGGTVLVMENFSPGTVDFTKQLKRVLGVSYAPPAVDKPATAAKADPLPTPRADLDTVYLAARSAQAKLIWPQMRYLRAGRIATYAPGTAADAGNSDLGGLNVCDAPWRIDNKGSTAALRGELAPVNPRTADAQRLFALGYDAYQLASRNTLKTIAAGEPMAGLTGSLVLEADGALHRRLDCVSLYSPRDNGAITE